MRKLSVNGFDYEYKIGKDFASIRNLSTNKRVSVPLSEITGLPPHVFEKERRNRTSDGMVTPSLIKNWILNLTNEGKPVPMERPPVKTCDIVEVIDGGIAVVDGDTGKAVWCHWEQSAVDALKWCAKNKYNVLKFKEMTVKSFNPTSSTIELDFSTE